MSKVIIFDKITTSFVGRGLGVLKDALSCKPYEYKNGSYECYLEYPISGLHSDLIVEENIIYCNTPRGYQPFRIYQISKNDADMVLEVYAMHIFYDLRDNIIEDTNIVGASAVGAINQILNKTQFEHPFIAGGTLLTTANSRLVRKNPVEAILGDDDNSILSRYGGEIERDNFNIKIHPQYGQNRGVIVKYSKDIKGLEVKCDMSTVVTRILPEGYNGFFLPDSSKYVDSDLINNYIHPKIETYTFSDVKVEGYYTSYEDGEEILTVKQGYEKLKELSKKLFDEQHVDLPETTVSISIVDLKRTNEYKDLSVLVAIYPFDTITIRHNPLGIDIEVQMNYWQYDSLNDEYLILEFGNAKSNLVNTTNKLNNISEVLEKNQTNLYQQAIKESTDLINDGLGGYVVKTRDEILIMDTADKNTATKVWRWNKNGLGFSSTGYNGTYSNAFTSDGRIIADRILTGTLKAILISNMDNSFTIDLSGYGGANLTTNGKKSMDLVNNKINFYNWGKDGDYIGAIGSINTKDSAYPGGNPNKPNIGIWNDLDSIISLSYQRSSGINGNYVTFDKYNILGKTGKCIKFYEGTQFNEEVYHYNPINMMGYDVYLSADGKAKVTGTTVNSTYYAAKVPNLYSEGKVWANGVELTNADYAEMFEWADKNVDKEDRIGFLVALEKNKIVKANGDNIIGIISGTACVIGDNANEWIGKYKTDKWGRYLLDSNGNKIINDEFDETKEYLDRSERSEWGTVGLVGKIVCRSDGTACVGDYIKAINGIATKSESATNIRVLEKIDNDTIRVFIK